MKKNLSFAAVLAGLALAALSAGATTYTDAPGDNYGGAEADINSVTVTNDASNLIITLNVTNTATISQYPNYLVGIQIGSGAGGQTLINNISSGATAGNPWGKTVGISSGENFCITVYPNGPSWTGAAALYQYSSATGWSQVGGSTPITEVASGAPSIKFSLPLSSLGLVAGNTFKFDVWSTYASPGGQGAYDALDSSVQAAGAPSSGTAYDSTTATGSTLASYTVLAASGYQVKFTFTVNMGIPITQGNFSIGGNTLYAFGSFDPAGTGWNSAGGVQLTNVPGTSNYSGSFITNNMSLGTAVQYKYAINGWGGTWEGNVGTNGAQNRAFTLASTNLALPVDYWNNVTNANASYAVTFQVNMLVEYLLGLFTPGSDYLYVNGDWDWSGIALQLLQTDNPYVYTGTVALALSPGMPVNYKYSINGTILWENDGVGPGGANNRQFILSATNLPGDNFNNYSNLGPLNLSGNLAQTILAWPSGSNANNHIRLQTATNLVHGWSDVPNTQGQSSVTNNFGPAPMFFRLIGP